MSLAAFYIARKEERMKRTKRREFVMNEREARELSDKAGRACMSESQLIRLLIAGYRPPVAPGKDFFDDMDALLKAKGELIAVSKECDSETAAILRAEALALGDLRLKLERKYLSGERSEF